MARRVGRTLSYIVTTQSGDGFANGLVRAWTTFRSLRFVEADRSDGENSRSKMQVLSSVVV